MKTKLSKLFVMKDLGLPMQILGIKITRNRANKKPWLSQKNAWRKFLRDSTWLDVRCQRSPHVSLSTQFEQCPGSEKEQEEMTKISYTSTIGSLMYVIVCMRPDIAHVVSVVCYFLSNSSKCHWKTMEWIMRYMRGTSLSKFWQ